MLVKEKIGNISSFAIADRGIDVVAIEWFEANKRILHKRTRLGEDIVIKFLNAAPGLTEGDILLQNETRLIIVQIQPCDAILIRPRTMFQMASLCYEIGNKHLPLFYENDEILVPFEAPLFRLLSAAGYEPERGVKKLVNPLKTTVSPHGHIESKQSLFSKILQLTTSSSDV